MIEAARQIKKGKWKKGWATSEMCSKRERRGSGIRRVFIFEKTHKKGLMNWAMYKNCARKLKGLRKGGEIGGERSSFVRCKCTKLKDATHSWGKKVAWH